MKLARTILEWIEMHSASYVIYLKQVAMFLYILAHHVKNRIVKHQFRRLGETISRHFKAYYTQLYGYMLSFLRNRSQFQKPLQMRNVNGLRYITMHFLLSLCHSTIILHTYILCLCIKNCLGALDGTHISVRVPLDNKPRYHNRK
jgi:hypothetical protein